MRLILSFGIFLLFSQIPWKRLLFLCLTGCFCWASASKCLSATLIHACQYKRDFCFLNLKNDENKPYMPYIPPREGWNKAYETFRINFCVSHRVWKIMLRFSCLAGCFWRAEQIISWGQAYFSPMSMLMKNVHVTASISLTYDDWRRAGVCTKMTISQISAIVRPHA